MTCDTGAYIPRFLWYSIHRTRNHEPTGRRHWWFIDGWPEQLIRVTAIWIPGCWSGESRRKLHENSDAWWRLCSSVNWVIIGSGNGLSPNGRQAISCNNAVLLPTGSLGMTFNQNFPNVIIWKCRLQNDDHFVQASVFSPRAYLTHSIIISCMRVIILSNLILRW